MSENLNPSGCNETTLAEMSALAQQIGTPVPPFPLFFTNAQCGGAITGSSFPLYFLPIGCDPHVDIPPSSANCLRVITKAEYSNGDHKLNANQINYLPSGLTGFGNIFPNMSDRLFSWYVPPQYTMIFFHTNPSLSIPSTIGQLEMSGNYLQVDACRADLRLSDGSRFWSSDPSPSDCENAITSGFQPEAPWFVLIQNESFSNMLVQMCTQDREILVGTNTLRTVWHPQSTACDLFMTNLCTVGILDNVITDVPLSELCACFTQSRALEAKFPKLNVSVCCFGQDASGDITKSCAFNALAYKTDAILKNCCSFAQCESIVSDDATLANVKCNANLVDFPVNVSVSVTPNTNDQILQQNPPDFVWYILGFAVALAFVLVGIVIWLKPVKTFRSEPPVLAGTIN